MCIRSGARVSINDEHTVQSLRTSSRGDAWFASSPSARVFKLIYIYILSLVPRTSSDGHHHSYISSEGRRVHFPAATIALHVRRCHARARSTSGIPLACRPPTRHCSSSSGSGGRSTRSGCNMVAAAATLLLSVRPPLLRVRVRVRVLRVLPW